MMSSTLYYIKELCVCLEKDFFKPTLIKSLTISLYSNNNKKYVSISTLLPSGLYVIY